MVSSEVFWMNFWFAHQGKLSLKHQLHHCWFLSACLLHPGTEAWMNPKRNNIKHCQWYDIVPSVFCNMGLTGALEAVTLVTILPKGLYCPLREYVLKFDVIDRKLSDVVYIAHQVSFSKYYIVTYYNFVYVSLGFWAFSQFLSTPITREGIEIGSQHTNSPNWLSCISHSCCWEKSSSLVHFAWFIGFSCTRAI